MPILSKAIGQAIGLGSEIQEHRKSSRSPSPLPEDKKDTADEKEAPLEQVSDTDEIDWAIDDALASSESLSERLSKTGGTEERKVGVETLINEFLDRHPKPDEPTRQLPAPVVLPQRRPEHKDRGFVRAYAPDLEACGVDQKTWFDFLDGFHRAIKMHPAFLALNLSILGAAIALDAVAGPSITAHLVAMALHTSVEASRRAFIIYETNKYLDAMNDSFFKPRGLYAMIMIYKPESTDATVDVDPMQTFTSAISSRKDGEGGKFKQSSGKARDALEAIEVAPLTYPQLEQLPEGEKYNKMQRAGHFLRDYYDRRQQALFDYNNPGSTLATPRKDFASKYSDPTHPANDGSLIGLVSGGRRQGILTRLKGGFKPGQEKGTKKFTKKILKQDVLYLMVVNMPSEQELEAATAQIQA